MSATGWTYYVPHQADADRALQELRQDVFTRRAYALAGDMMQGMSETDIVAAMPAMADLQKQLKVAKAVDRAMKELGADTEGSEKDTKGVERFIQDAEARGVAKAAKRVAGGRRKKTPKSIDDALKMSRESGTHSILDITSVLAVKGFGLATPLTRDELLTIFGTDKPTQEMARLKEQEGTLASMRDRWEAAYFTVFEGKVPVSIVFCGRSGD